MKKRCHNCHNRRRDMKRSLIPLATRGSHHFVWKPIFQQALPTVCERATFFTSTSNRSLSSFGSNGKSDGKARPDPFARRPNQKCDPYGQGGKPLTLQEAESLLNTVHSEWSLEGNGSEDKKFRNIPTHLTRSFVHPDFIAGASFLNHVAAVAQMNDHFPSVTLERKLDSKRKQWLVVSTVSCHTFVLQGLSHHDFFVATVSLMYQLRVYSRV